MDKHQLKNILEAALLAHGQPLTVKQLQGLFGVREAPETSEIRAAIKSLQEDYKDRGIELLEVASGFRIQVRATTAPHLSKLWEEKPPRYSRALLETLAIIAYRQPVTRGDIEDIRGVSVTTNIIRTLLERNWIKVVGHRDVPGKPAMFGSTKEFLDYFGLKKLDDLPPLAELADLEPVGVQLDIDSDNTVAAEAADTGDSNAKEVSSQARDNIEETGGEDADTNSADSNSDGDPELRADADTQSDRVTLLIGLNPPGEEPETATVTSLDVVRARG